MTSRPSAEPMPARPAGPAPRVSVVMTVYNAGAFLAPAIRSVLEQDFTDFEFLAHDDGSTDGSDRVLRDHAARDPRLIVTSGPNRGVPAVANELIGRARAPLIARFDADDICRPGRFSAQVARFDADPDLVALGTSYLVMDGAGRPVYPNRMPRGHETIDALNLSGRVALHQPTVMMRRDAVLRAGGYDESFRSAQDHDLWLRLAEIGKLDNLPDLLLEYRLHSGSISGSKSQQQQANCRRACEKAWERRGTRSEFLFTPWRMEDTRASRRDFYLRYAWQAWKNGYRGTWRHYALAALRQAPLSPAAWKVLVLGALRRPPAPGAPAAVAAGGE